MSKMNICAGPLAASGMLDSKVAMVLAVTTCNMNNAHYVKVDIQSTRG